jgi:hypothetical protein
MERRRSRLEPSLVFYQTFLPCTGIAWFKLLKPGRTQPEPAVPILAGNPNSTKLPRWALVLLWLKPMFFEKIELLWELNCENSENN